MFGWLAKMLVSSPIQGSGCSCCEGKKKRLEKMQEAIADGSVVEEVMPESCGCGSESQSCGLGERKMSFSSGGYALHIANDGSWSSEYYAKKKSCSCGSECDCGCNEGKPCTCGEKCSGDDVCHCGKGDDCCKKTGKKNDCHCGDGSHCDCGKH